MKEKNPVNDSVFGLSFEGEYVSIITKTKIKRNYVNSETGDVIEEVIPLTINGFILDIDDLYYYLGEDPHQINKAVKITSVTYIEVNDPKSEYDDILDSIGNEPGEQEIN